MHKQQRPLFGKLKDQQKIPQLEGKLRQAHQLGSDVEFLKEKVKSLELKLVDEQRKNKKLERSLRELELQRSTAELKVTS